MHLNKFVTILIVITAINLTQVTSSQAQATNPTKIKPFELKTIYTIEQPVVLHLDHQPGIQWLTPNLRPHFKILNIDTSNQPYLRYHIIINQHHGWFITKAKNVIDAYYQNHDLKFGQELIKTNGKQKIYQSPNFKTARWHWSKFGQILAVQQLVPSPTSHNHITRVQVNSHTYLSGDKQNVKLME